MPESNHKEAVLDKSKPDCSTELWTQIVPSMIVGSGVRAMLVLHTAMQYSCVSYHNMHDSYVRELSSMTAIYIFRKLWCVLAVQKVLSHQKMKKVVQAHDDRLSANMPYGLPQWTARATEGQMLRNCFQKFSSGSRSSRIVALITDQRLPHTPLSTLGKLPTSSSSIVSLLRSSATLQQDQAAY